jgi:multidrug efflux pump subunit AcrA (membrane-fusion protein)
VINTVQVAEANLQSAEAQATIAQRALADAQVKAPFSGVIAKRWVNVGDKVTSDMPVAHVVDLGRMELEAQIPVGEIPFRARGPGDRLHGRRLPGAQIQRQGGARQSLGEAGSRSIMVFVTLPNADASLKGGMFANGISPPPPERR